MVSKLKNPCLLTSIASKARAGTQLTSINFNLDISENFSRAISELSILARIVLWSRVILSLIPLASYITFLLKSSCFAAGKENGLMKDKNYS